MSFSVDIAKFAKKTNDTLDKSCRVIKIKLFSAVIRDTRVDTGRLRGNWQTSTGSPNTSTTERLDKTGSKAIRDVTRTVKGNTVDYMTNNLPYAAIYEEKDAMVARNMARIERLIREISSDVS